MGGKLLKQITTLHEKPITALKYNGVLDLVVSVDDTKKTNAISFSFSPNGKLLAFLCSDGIVRVFRMLDGKMIRSYDESLEMYSTAQNDPKMEQLHLNKFDFGRRYALEKELEKSNFRKHQSLVFDESGNILMIPTLIGIKVINIVTNKLFRIIGKSESERPLYLALLQGKVEKPDMTGDISRDIIDEMPTKEELQKAALTISKDVKSLSEKPNKLTLYTNVGDIVIKLFPEASPKAIPAEHLNGEYPIVGRVIHGADVVSYIENVNIA
ncbi:uncharacterized protein LOC133320767 [Danaus plexippus]|uniref:uncharacterized protein LOC133320767 n=1 Tax=Danaus plexippus TaxID=13037 RepID=UPI002AB2B468|nr:uncharacterized protein LOC133320767 [Danaus plexippus]